MEKLLTHYHAACKAGDMEADASQLEVVHTLDKLMSRLEKPARRWVFRRKKPRIKGLYLHGPVGVGKTWLMDLFYENLPQGMAARYHFHYFMQQVDAQLRKQQGQSNPLKKIAADLARRTRVLCLDEFMVHDVAHAMILAELLHALFAQGLVLVATSNTPPDKLYANGVQRQRFLPAIALIKTHCDCMPLVARRDYRLGREPLTSAWYTPANAKSDAAMENQFLQLHGEIQTQTIRLQNRNVSCRGLAPDAIWFDFNQICNLPRSQLDYLELARRFSAVFVSHIPQLGKQHTAQAVLFIYFVDIMYDNGVRLVISSAVPLEDLCSNREMAPEFARTRSRLEEMQSSDFAQRHQHRRLYSSFE